MSSAVDGFCPPSMVGASNNPEGGADSCICVSVGVTSDLEGRNGVVEIEV